MPEPIVWPGSCMLRIRSANSRRPRSPAPSRILPSGSTIAVPLSRCARPCLDHRVGRHSRHYIHHGVRRDSQLVADLENAPPSRTQIHDPRLNLTFRHRPASPPASGRSPTRQPVDSEQPDKNTARRRFPEDVPSVPGTSCTPANFCHRDMIKATRRPSGRAIRCHADVTGGCGWRRMPSYADRRLALGRACRADAGVRRLTGWADYGSRGCRFESCRARTQNRRSEQMSPGRPHHV